MHTTTNEAEIFAWLEKTGRASFDPRKAIVFSFYYEQCWSLFIFNPSGNLKGCRLYLIETAKLGFEVEKLLVPSLLDLDEGYGNLINDGLAIAEQVLLDKKNDLLFFDGH